MIVYFDTSALVATYVTDDCTVDAMRTRKRASTVTTSLLAYAETLAAFAALHRMGRLSLRQRRGLEARFVVDWTEFQGIRLERRLLPEIRRILTAHALKGADAVHLASAAIVGRGCARAEREMRFACDDRALGAAAVAEGLPLAW